jgi:hypothetical protein
MILNKGIPAYTPHGTFMHDDEQLAALITHNAKKKYLMLGANLTSAQQKAILAGSYRKALPTKLAAELLGCKVYEVGSRSVVVGPDGKVWPQSYVTTAAALAAIEDVMRPKESPRDKGTPPTNPPKL